LWTWQTHDSVLAGGFASQVGGLSVPVAAREQPLRSAASTVAILPPYGDIGRQRILVYGYDIVNLDIVEDVVRNLGDLLDFVAVIRTPSDE